MQNIFCVHSDLNSEQNHIDASMYYIYVHLNLLAEASSFRAETSYGIIDPKDAPNIQV